MKKKVEKVEKVEVVEVVIKGPRVISPKARKDSQIVGDGCKVQ